MLERWIDAKVKKELARNPAVALLGPRQVGKTTLAGQIERSVNSSYLDLQNPEDMAELNDPISFLRSHNDKLVILDEAQLRSDLFTVFRSWIDRDLAAGRRAGQFLLLGSASMKLRQASESLAGRISYVEMSGLNLLECGAERLAINKLWVRGGFPESYLSPGDDVAMDWLENLISDYTERDIPQMEPRVRAVRLRRLWTMLAHSQGEPLSDDKLAASLAMDAKTVRGYVDILDGLLLIRRLPPWHANMKKRLVKEPRYYIRDSGIQHRLLGIENHSSLLSNPTLGKSWEGFVIENIHSVLPNRAETYFYRTAAGAEIDLVLKLPPAEVWAIEIKYGVKPKVSEPFARICDEIGAAKKYVVYGGDDEFSKGDDITVISLNNIMQQLAAHQS